LGIIQRGTVARTIIGDASAARRQLSNLEFEARQAAQQSAQTV
jgi:hypothetical protein